MTQENQQPTTNPTRRSRRILRTSLLSILIIVVLVLSSIVVMMSTDRGSRYLLDRVLKAQKIIHYDYASGNLLSGVVLKNILVQLKSVDVSMDQAQINLGWRALLHKEVHLDDAVIRNLVVVNKTPPSGKPFAFNPIRLPFVLRVDEADIDHLEIKTTTATVKFDDLYLKKAVWQGTKLKFKDTRLDMGYLSVNKASGQIDFQGKYPLQIKADVKIPALKSLNINTIKLYGTGTLDTLQAGIATQTPDLLTGWTVLHPVRQNVPMMGQLQFKNYHWPLANDQKLFSQKGIADFKGDIKRLNLNIDTDLKGQSIPEGRYQATMHTDLVNQLNIDEFTGQLMQGSLNLDGFVRWKNFVSWDIKGHMQGINPKQEQNTLPQVVQDFLPAVMDGDITSTGSLEKGLALQAAVDFDRYETWTVDLNQAKPISNKKAAPMLLKVQWSDIDRAMPYLGWLKSDQGQVDLNLVQGQQDILVKTHVYKHEKALLPEGQYQAKVQLKKDIVNIPEFEYLALNGHLNGQAKLNLPTEKRQMSWNANLHAKNFNPQSVTAASPVNSITGQIQANGYALPNQQIIHLQHIDLQGQLKNGDKTETLSLGGKSTAAILFNEAKVGGGLKAYAVNYDGHLNALGQGNGLLKAKVAGTKDYIKINELKHEGVAGKVYASGLVNLKNRLLWDIDASFVRFKPHYFVSKIKGELSGVVKSKGVWANDLKQVSIEQLNLAGFINNKPLRGKGNLALVINTNQKGFLPEKFEANNLFLSYAQNQIQASGNAQNLKIRLNAPALYELYPSLQGRAYGYVDVQSQPRLKALANIAVDNFAYGSLLGVKKLRIQGELPTSESTATMLSAKLDQLVSGKREIQQAELNLAGTRKAHIFKLRANNRISDFYVQLAGGFNPNNDWLGEIQQGRFNSKRIKLEQDHNTPVIYTAAKSELYIAQHCWLSSSSKLCFDQPTRLSPSKANFSFLTQNLDLNDFAAFMPEGLAITGQLNGYAKASWAKGKRPVLDAKFLTRKGEIGLAADDPQDPATTLAYDDLSLIVKSIQEGLLLRFDVKTPEIGTGYANVVINPFQSHLPMRGEVAFDAVQLKLFKPFIKDVRTISGHLALAGKIAGTLKQPEFTGEMRLKNGVISMISLPVNLTNIQLHSSIRQNYASLDGAFNSGRGVGVLKGGFDWKNEPRLQLNLKGNDLLVRQAPVITAIADTDLSLDVLPLKKSLSLTGTVDIPRAQIAMPEASAPVVAVSPDVRIVRQGQDQLAILRAAKPWSIRADMTVTIGNKVFFKGFNSTIPLIGRLYLTQRGHETAMRAMGAIGVTQKVNIEAYGQSLELNRAIARFNGLLANPSLDVEANKSVQGSNVGVRVTGTAKSPNIQIFNDAGLSEQEALNALITGRINEGSSGLSNTEGFKSDVNNTIAAAGISMGLGGTRALTNQIGRSFGLSGLALDAQGTGDDTQVSLTGYITPDLFIRYGIGVFTPVNKLTLRYQMNRRLYLEASQSLERAIDLFYNWRF